MYSKQHFGETIKSLQTRFEDEDLEKIVLIPWWQFLQFWCVQKRCGIIPAWLDKFFPGTFWPFTFLGNPSTIEMAAIARKAVKIL